jgi:adenylate cyclase
MRLAEIDRARRKHPESLDAYDRYLRALPNLYTPTRDGTEDALRLLRRALALDPGFAAASALIALLHEVRNGQGWGWLDVDHHDYAEAVQAARDPEALAMAAQALGRLGRFYDEAIEIADRAIALNPNSALVLNSCGWGNVYANRPQEAISCFKRAYRVDPLDPLTYSSLAAMALAHLELNEDQAAIAAAQRAVQQNPNYGSAWRSLAAALAPAGRDA